MNKKLITITLMLGLLASSASFAAPFTDTTDQSVDYAYQNNLMKGMTKSTFAPNNVLTRGQFATVLANLTKETPSGILPFTDVKKSAYYYNSILLAYNNKIIAGTSEYTFSPNATLNREQVASMTSAYMAKSIKDVQENKIQFNDLNQASSWARESIQVSGKVFQDAGIVYGNNFEPKRAFTRLEVAKLISHLDKLKKNIAQPTYTSQNPIDPQPNTKQTHQDFSDNQNEEKETWDDTIKDWFEMIDEITHQPYKPTKEQQIMMNMVNAERIKVGVAPLKFMPELKSIANIRVKEVHDWYKLYADDESKAPANRPTPHYRINSTYPFNAINKNTDIFKHTKFYKFLKKPPEYNIINLVMNGNFSENVVYGDSTNSVRIKTKTLIASKGHYKNMTNPKWTHAFYAKYDDGEDSTWIQIFFDANDAKIAR